MPLTSDDLVRIQQAAALGTDPNLLGIEPVDEVRTAYDLIVAELDAAPDGVMVEPLFDWPGDTWNELIAATFKAHGEPRWMAIARDKRLGKAAGAREPLYVLKHPGHADQSVHNPHGGGGGGEELTSRQRKMLDAVRSSGTSDAARAIHNAATGHWEVAQVNDALGLDDVRSEDVVRVSQEIAAEARKSLAERGYGESFEVWRTGSLTPGEVISVTTRPGGLSSFRGEVQRYRVSRQDVLTDTDGLLRGGGTFAEDELHVLADDLEPLGIEKHPGSPTVKHGTHDQSSHNPHGGGGGELQADG